MTFQELNLIEPVLQALNKAGYKNPTRIQEKAIPGILEGKDVFGCAQTGTGKTAAFALPVLQMIYQQGEEKKKGIKTLVLAPTRELASQIGESFTIYGYRLGLKVAVIYGGVSQGVQTRALQNGVDILVATPGRLLDLMNQGYVRFHDLQFFILDEVDRMLDMGFIEDIKKIVSRIPAKRQTLFFSATIPQEIKKFASSLLHQPLMIEAAPVSSPAGSIAQSVYYVDKLNKKALLKHIIVQDGIDHALVFTRTKRGADKVVKELNRNGISAEAIHGDKSQRAREKALKGFKSRTIRILVATDIASRGIDVDKLSHVINFEIPEQPETYVHRIGRTGRAGASGNALSFCANEELPYLKSINRLLKKNISEVSKHPFISLINRGINMR